MRNHDKENYWLCRAALLIVLLPLFLGAFLAPSFGVVDILKRGIVTKGPVAIPIGYFMLAGYMAAFVLLMLRARITLPLILMFVSYLLVIVADMGSDRDNLQIVLQIGAGGRTVGKDVYCNDVFLGRTPLTISREEFYEKVKPRSGPPRQQRMEIRAERERDRDATRYFWARYYWIPYDIFDYYKGYSYFGGDRKKPLWGVHDDEKLLAFFKTGKYWWHFDKDGCVGLSRATNFSGGYSGRGNLLTVEANPPFEIVSVDRHFQVVLEDLRRKKFRPDQRWLKHFSTYQDLLFGPLHQYASKHPEAEQAVEDFVRYELNIPETVEAGDCRRVLDEILDRAERTGRFVVPSVESVAVELVCKEHLEVLAEHFVKAFEIPRDWGGSDGVRSSDNYKAYRRSGRSVRQLPLEYAVRKYRPPQLYNRLVYMAAKDPKYVEFAANYRRPESVKFFQHYLRKARTARPNVFGRRHSVGRAIGMCARVHNPALENDIRFFVSNQTGGSRIRDDMYARQFVESRVHQYRSDPNLPGWIQSYAPLEDIRKAELIAQLHSRKTLHPLSYLSSVNPRCRERALSVLNRDPNPFADEFLIDSYHWYASPSGPRHMPSDLIWAMLKLDTPKIRDFIREIWDDGGSDRRKLMEQMRSLSWNHSHLDWLVPEIEQLTDKDERTIGIGFLPRIGTDNAEALLVKWTKDPDEKVAKAAKWHLDRLGQKQKEDQKNQVSQETVDQLLTGRVKPDDLLDPAQAYVWDGEKYVPEKQQNRQDAHRKRPLLQVEYGTK
jgi:hypothetical protein